ncbi:MAG: hypothetical protein Q8941_17355 [Bacteroidota bacterium]|nr:hypothetical protein [Bacteroidota bacterium]
MTNDTSSGEKEKKSFWDTTTGTITKITALLTAITGLILAIKPYFKTSHNDLIPPAATIINYDSIATDMANQWCNDLKNRNVDGLVASSSLPFYADSRILNSLPDVRASYTSITARYIPAEIVDSTMRSPDENIPVLFELKIYKSSELKTRGYDEAHDRILRSLNLENDPYIGMLGFSYRGRREYTELVFRKTGNTLKIAGWWD